MRFLGALNTACERCEWRRTSGDAVQVVMVWRVADYTVPGEPILNEAVAESGNMDADKLPILFRKRESSCVLGFQDSRFRAGGDSAFGNSRMKVINA